MRTKKVIISILAILLATSCEMHQRMVRMVTTLEHNGKVHREIYAYEAEVSNLDSAKFPFLFHRTPDWKITSFDTAVKFNFFGENVEFSRKISKSANSIEQYSLEIQYDEEYRSFAQPEEFLAKHFRWFYTYYSFQTVYKKLQYEIPVPIDKYLTKEEQLLWTQGDINKYKTMNGSEINDYLLDISNKFLEWYGRNRFEISFEIVKKRTTGYNLDSIKEKIYPNSKEAQIDPQTVCTVLDSLYKTIYFSELYKTNKEALDKEFETETAVLNLVGTTIRYELVIPDRLIKTDAPIINSDTLIWKVDGMRLLFDDYTLTAEYRTPNTWTFVISGLIVLTAIACLILRKWRKYC